MAEIAKYLLRSERSALEVRHHWAALTPYAATTAMFWAGGLLALWLFADVALLRVTCVFFLLFSLGWFAWMVGEWHLERFVVTDRRVLLLTGILTKRVAIMPLTKVTDLTYERTILGRLLGYGVFNIESAGQQQALSRIEFIPHPDELYQEVSGLLFGAETDDDGTGSSASGPGPHEPPQGPHGNGPDGGPHSGGPAGRGAPGRHSAPEVGAFRSGPPPPPPLSPPPPLPPLPDPPPWELPQPPEHRAVAPTTPLPTLP